MVSSGTLPRGFGRTAFGGDPAGYHAARPGYPDWVFGTLRDRCGLGRDTAVFEIGPGTGIATRRLLDLGADPLTAIEPDRRLADFLRRENPDPALRVIVAPFEEVELPEGSFDLGVSATAFHWLDEDAALARIARLLRPGGWWVAFWNVFGDGSRSDPFHAATRAVLKGSSSPAAGDDGIPFGLDGVARRAALDRTCAFGAVESISVPWSLSLDPEGVVALYASYSNVIGRPDREAVLAELDRIARDEFGGRVVRNMTTSLYLAQRAGNAP
jgi:SAM-dependent methyltransferase